MKFYNHRSQVMLSKSLFLLLFVISILFLNGCNLIGRKTKSTPTLLKTEEASKQQLLDEINRFAQVKSMRAKMSLKFEDDSYAQLGSKEVFISADLDLVVQRPSNILLKISGFGVSVAQMTSNGENFRVAILYDGGSGKNKKFVKGTNSSDYSLLKKKIDGSNLNDEDQKFKKNASAFANVRPQHVTDAVLVSPIDANKIYVQSTISQIETDTTKDKKSPLRNVVRGYYLFDELAKNTDGELRITRRFWFDRVGGTRLARQQLFDAKGEIDSDIIYGQEGLLSGKTELGNLPLRISVTRPKDNYTMSLEYDAPESVTIGNTYPEKAFNLENSWELEEVDLDQKLREAQEKISKVQK
jgi:hypothetical protein